MHLIYVDSLQCSPLPTPLKFADSFPFRVNKVVIEFDDFDTIINIFFKTPNKNFLNRYIYIDPIFFEILCLKP
ncbi:unnamed protein product [Moneuplotes crassus]|uniref:Uncharacterized protein n=1 Tax=Euplotes crassus TaxID=5936 RepID=A0AAD2D0J9_EUPCR|nr:unnamed protein product [Moneuplotes crassus]